MRSIIRSYAVPTLLGSTLVYALPQNRDLLRYRAYSASDIVPVYGSVAGSPDTTPSQTPNADQGNTNPTPAADVVPSASNSPLQIAATNPTSQAHDTSGPSTNTYSVSTTSGSRPNPNDQTFSALDVIPTSSPSTSTGHGTLAPVPSVASSHGVGGHGVLTGVVAGGLVIGFLILTVGLWFCYRRRGPTSGASTPKYTTAVVGDEKPRPVFPFLRGGTRPWKKNHVRVRSSMSFASPILENEPKMMESGSSSRTPLAPHLSGSSASRGDWNNARWSTFSTSDSSAYPQTPVGGHLSGIIMETVVETDAASDPRTPTMTPRPDVDYLVLQRGPKDAKLPPPLATTFDPRVSPPPSQRFSDEGSTPTTTSSGRLTYGSIGHGSHYIRTTDRLSQQPTLPTHLSLNNGSGSLVSGSNSTALLATRPKFNVTSANGSDTVSLGQESGETIKITNPFLDDEDGISSYGHGMIEADDRESLRSLDSDIRGAYPSSTGCLDPKAAPSPSPDAPLTRPRSSLISDASSDYPYPLGYAIDSEGNVANPFLRISELLEEVDGRMRWPSPPLLPRAESRNY